MAASEHDHKLKWELFRLSELDCFEAMLRRLFKELAEEIVMNYERYRLSLVGEMEKRRMESSPTEQQKRHALEQSEESVV